MSGQLPAINSRFARRPAKPENGHVPLLDHAVLPDVFCRQSVRVVSRDHVITFARHFYFVPEHLLPRPTPGDRVTVRVWMDGTVHFYWKDNPLLVEEFQPHRTGKEGSESLSA